MVSEMLAFGENTTDEFGLDVGNLLEKALLVIIYGQPKAGKSTSAAVAYNDCLFMTSDEMVLRPYASYYEMLKKDSPAEFARLGLRHPSLPWKSGGLARKNVPELIEWPPKSGKLVRANNWKQIRDYLFDKYIPNVLSGRWPFKGIVFDEWSTFSRRIDLNMTADPSFEARSGKVNFWDVQKALAAFHGELCQVARITSRPVVLIAHEKPPSYYPENWHEHWKAGKLKYKGGPAFPYGQLIKECCAQADVVLRCVVEDCVPVAVSADALMSAKPKDPSLLRQESNVVRKFVCEVSEEWEGGFRDFRVKTEESLDLRALLERVGVLRPKPRAAA
jgi:hypothetical protein